MENEAKTKELSKVFETCQAAEDLLMKAEEHCLTLFYAHLHHNPYFKVDIDKKGQGELILLLQRALEVRHLAGICEARVDSCVEFLARKVPSGTPIPPLVEKAMKSVREKRLARD